MRGPTPFDHILHSGKYVFFLWGVATVCYTNALFVFSLHVIDNASARFFLCPELCFAQSLCEARRGTESMKFRSWCLWLVSDVIIFVVERWGAFRGLGICGCLHALKKFWVFKSFRDRYLNHSATMELKNICALFIILDITLQIRGKATLTNTLEMLSYLH